MAPGECAATKTIFITGISGFVGTHVARSALGAGLSVVGSVRDRSLAGALTAAVAPRGTADQLKLVELDLVSSSEAEFAEAMRGCDYLAHVASPFPGFSISADEMTAAIDGTAKVLRAAATAGVTRAVLTSSVVAVDGNQPKGSKRGQTVADPFTSDDWTRLDGLDSSYAESKTVAERRAGGLCAELGLPLAAVNPSFVQGPLLLARAPTSAHLGKRVLEGAMPAVPPIGMNVCDVRDVADVHVKALLSGADGGRYIVSSGNILLTDLPDRIRASHPAWPVKTRRAPWLLMKLYSYFDGQAASLLGKWRLETHYDAAPAAALLGRELGAPYAACLDMVDSLVELGVAKK